MNKITYCFDENKYEVSEISSDKIQRITFREKETDQNFFTLTYKPDMFSIEAYRKDVTLIINGESLVIWFDHIFEANSDEFPLETIECEGIKITL